MPKDKRNLSELLFEESMEAHAYTNWTREQPIESKEKRPAYRLEDGGSSWFFQVKEFEPRTPSLRHGCYDPYRPIRDKINQTADDLKKYREYSCSVVLANPYATLVHIGDPWAMIGAMLGSRVFQFELCAKTDTEYPIEHGFIGSSKRVKYKRDEPQNPAVSAAIVLSTYPLRQSQIHIAIRDRNRELGRETSLSEDLEFYDTIPDGPELRRVRVIVYDNPFARIPLCKNLFRGPFDERWGVDGKFMRRIYVGEEVRKIEALLGVAP